MYFRRYRTVVTTVADGSATAYTDNLNGALYALKYTKHGTTPFDDGVDFVITTEDTALAIWSEENVNATALRLPRAQVCSTAGVVQYSDSLAGATIVGEPIALAHERVKIVIASGGNVKIGTFDVWVT